MYTRSLDPLEVLLSVAVFVLAFFTIRFRLPNKKKYLYPPGPKGLPLFGVFFDIFDYPTHLAYTTWSKTFGGIFTANMMGRKSVILNDIETMREALQNCSPLIDDRPDWRYCFTRLLRGLSVMPYSNKWSNTRRRTMSILRDYGMGKSFLEPQMYDETHALIANILRDCDDGRVNIQMKDRIRRTPVNILCNMLYSERYEYDDEDLLFILQTMEYLLTYLRTACMYDCLPRPLKPALAYSLRDFHAKIDILHNFLASKVKYHEETYKDGVQRDFVDAWIKFQRDLRKKADQRADIDINNIQRKSEDIKASDALSYDEESYSPVVNVLQDVMIAGAHSIGYAMNWMILLLTLEKDLQNKLYEAILEAIGPDGRATTADRPHLPIVEAIIHETLRFSSLVPLVGHCALDDVTLCGFRLPKQTEVMFNNWAVNHDERHFPSPDEYLPDRWIKEDGSFNRELTTKFFPFGFGKRSCAGETLAKTEVFIITVTLFQNLEFLMPDESVDPKLVPEIKFIQGIVMEPKPFAVRVRKRHSKPT